MGLSLTPAQYKTPELSIEDYHLDQLKTGVTIPITSASQLAAGEAIMREQPSVDEYRQIRDNLMSPEGREAFILRQEERRMSILSSYENDLGDILLDPEISDEDKKMYLEGVKNAKENYKPSSIDVMVEEAVVSQNKETETEAEFQNRLGFVDMIKEVNNQKREATARINALRAERDPSKIATAVDLAELLVPFAEWVDVNQMYQQVVGGDKWLMGSQRAELFDVMKKLPYDKRAEFSEKIIDFVENHDSVLLPDGNDLVALDTLQQMIVENEYSNTEKWVDNIFSVIEFTGVFGLLGKAAKTGKTAKTVKAAKEVTHSEVVPTSPSQLIKDANPESARGMHEAALQDESGEAAEALYGATREEAAAKDLLPEPEMEPGTIPNKVVFDEPQELRTLRRTDGQTYLSEGEVSRVSQKVIDDLSNVEGMVPHKESTVIRTNTDGSTGISMIFRPKDSGFRTADQALENAEFAFRNFGLTKDDFVLYRRSGDKWIKTTPKLLKARKELRDEFTRKKQKIPADLKEIDYAVGIDYTYDFNPQDLQGYDLLATNRIFGMMPANILDRAPSGMSRVGQGSLTQNLLDASSVLHPQIVEPAMVATDKGVALKKAYVEVFKGFTKGYKSLSKDRRAILSNYINKANYEGIPFNEFNLRAQGFENNEIELLREWRKANDIMFHATNDDMAKTLRNKGYRIFTHGATDTKLVVKPMKRGSVSSATRYYDINLDEIRNADNRDSLDKFYEEGGTYAQLSDPIEVNGEWIDVIKVDENKDAGYMRAIKSDERVLHYRDGYYPVMYDANFFVYKTLKKADGTEFQKVVASAKTKSEADNMVRMIRQSDPEAQVDYRPDRRAEADRSSSFDEMGWQVGVTSGISSQKVRGERLLDASGGLNKAGMSNLVDPLEAVSNQISQLANRVSMRNYLDATKQRWLDNYAEPLGLEVDRTGNYRFPSSIAQVKGKGTTDPQTLADARSLFNYVYSLENGYINYIDEGFKAAFNFGADLMAGMKWNKAEEALRDWGKGSLTQAGKAAVFKMYLAANPQRQLIIQAHQSVQLSAINPTYLVGPMQWDLYRIGRAMRGYEGDKEALDMYKELKNSGMLDAVDANNLVRQDMLRLADLTVAQKAKTVANKPLEITQRVGFDTAEQFVLVTSWLAHRDLAKKSGKALTRRDYDDIAGKARSYTYGMNRAGDMPYNQNSLNIVAQFLQVPHKAILQPLTNKSLTPRQRGQLLAWNTVMYGVPAGVAASFTGWIEPGKLKDSIEHGIEYVLLNEVTSAMTGEEQQVDWGDLSPTDLHGMNDFLLSLFTSDLSTMVAESPAGSLLFGANPRIQNLLSTTARWVHLRDDYDDPELDTKYTDVARAAANLFSGYSNAFKSHYAFETGTKISSLGNLTDNDVTEFEAAMQFFGFRTQTEEGSRKINEKLFEGRSFQDNDVTSWYNDLKRQLARKGMTVAERDMAQRILTEGMRVFKNDPVKFQDRLYNAIKSDVEQDGYNIFEQIIKQMGWQSKSDLLKLLEELPESPEKSTLRDSINKLGENE